MPSAAPRPCTKPGCKAYAVKNGRCDQHQVAHRWEHSKNRHQRGYGHQWVKTRDAVMQRDRHLCQVCLTDGIYTKATQVDHITPKALGGTDNASNLQAICTHCHREKTAKEGLEGRQS